MVRRDRWRTVTRPGGAPPDTAPAVLHVLGGREPDQGHLGPSGPDPGRYPDRQRAGGYFHPVRHHRVRPDCGPGADHRVVEDYRPRPHQRLVLEQAPLEMGQVADHTPLPHHCGKARSGVDHRAILDRGSCAHRDRAEVAAEDRTGPHGGLRPERDVADDHRLGVDIGLGVDDGDLVAEAVDGHRRIVGPRSPRAAMTPFRSARSDRCRWGRGR